MSKTASRFKPITTHRFGNVTPMNHAMLANHYLSQRLQNAEIETPPVEENIELNVKEQNTDEVTTAMNIGELHELYKQPEEEFKHDEQEIKVQARPRVHKAKSLQLKDYSKPRKLF